MKIKEIRQSKGISQRKAALDLGLSPVVYGRYENNIRKPDPEMLATIAAYFDVTVDELIGVSKKKSFRNLPPELKKLVTTDQPVHLPDIATDENGDGLPDHLVLDFGSSETNPALFGGINDALMRLFDEAGDLSSEEADLTRAFVLGLKAKRKAAAAPPPSNQK